MGRVIAFIFFFSSALFAVEPIEYAGHKSHVDLAPLRERAISTVKKGAETGLCSKELYEAGEFLNELVFYKARAGYLTGQPETVWLRNEGVHNYFIDMLRQYPDFARDKAELKARIIEIDQKSPAKQGNHGPDLSYKSPYNLYEEALKITGGNAFRASTLIGALGHDDVSNIPPSSNLFARGSVGVEVKEEIVERFVRAGKKCVAVNSNVPCSGTGSAFNYHVNFGFYLGCQLAKKGFKEAKINKALADATALAIRDPFLDDDLKCRKRAGPLWNQEYCIDTCSDIPKMLGYFYKKTTMKKWLSDDAHDLYERGYHRPFQSFARPGNWDEERYERAVAILDYRLMHLEYGSAQAEAGAKAGAAACKAYRDKAPNGPDYADVPYTGWGSEAYVDHLLKLVDDADVANNQFAKELSSDQLFRYTTEHVKDKPLTAETSGKAERLGRFLAWHMAKDAKLGARLIESFDGLAGDFSRLAILKAFEGKPAAKHAPLALATLKRGGSPWLVTEALHQLYDPKMVNAAGNRAELLRTLFPYVKSDDTLVFTFAIRTMFSALLDAEEKGKYFDELINLYHERLDRREILLPYINSISPLSKATLDLNTAALKESYPGLRLTALRGLSNAKTRLQPMIPDLEKIYREASEPELLRLATALLIQAVEGKGKTVDRILDDLMKEKDSIRRSALKFGLFETGTVLEGKLDHLAKLAETAPELSLRDWMLSHLIPHAGTNKQEKVMAIYLARIAKLDNSHSSALEATRIFEGSFRLTGKERVPVMTSLEKLAARHKGSENDPYWELRGKIAKAKEGK